MEASMFRMLSSSPFDQWGVPPFDAQGKRIGRWDDYMSCFPSRHLVAGLSIYVLISWLLFFEFSSCVDRTKVQLYKVTIGKDFQTDLSK